MPLRHRSRVPLAALFAIVAAACSRPLTDIVATNTEDTGEYQVFAKPDGTALTADVCLSPSADVDEIAERITRQLVNHGYSTITLRMIATHADGRAEATSVTWTRQQGLQQRSQATADQHPCAGRDVHGTSS